MNKILRFLIPFTAALSVLVFLFLLADKEARATTPTIIFPPETAGNNQQTSSNGDFSKVASYSKLHSVTQTDQSLMVIPPMSESEGGWENQCLDDCIKHNISMTGKNIAINSNGIPHIAYGADQLYYGWYDGLDWNIQVIDATPGAGAGASLVLDHNNYPHIAYNSPSGILYAYQDASGWHTEWVTNAYYNPSLALDQNDNPHISCYQSPNLYYGYKDQTGWHFEVINTQAYENYWLTLDQDGNPHLAASRRRNNLIYIFRDLNGWHTELIDEWNRNFGSPSIAIDSTRLPHIVYNIGQGINYAFKDADGWHIEGVSGGYLSQISLVLDILDRPHFVTTHDFQYCAGSYFFRDELGWHGLPMTDNVCGYPSIFLDTNNIPHVLYPNNNGSLIYEKHEETGWKKTVVDSGLLTGKYNSIEIDSNFYLHASTYEDFYNDLRYIYQDSLGTHAEVIDAEGSVGKYSSLALDTSSYPHISYYNESNGDLKYAYQDPSGWHIQTLESAGDIGLYTSLELNEYGYAHISYYDQTNMDLKFAYQDSSGWHIQTIDSAGDVGLYSSLVMDSLGNPHFSYYDATNHTLKYDGQIIDNEGEVGKYSSLSLDINDRPHISYYDETQGDLKYLFFDDLGWHTEIVDSSGDVGQFSSLALHGGTEPYISYSDTTKKDLKFAFRTSHGWETRTIDYLGNVGSHTSIQLDEGGYPWIVYSDEDNFDIKFARYWFDLPPDGWRVEVVDSELLVGSHSSIAMDEQDGIHISYYDEMTPSLKYAQFDGLNWNIQTVDSFGQDTSIALDEDGYAHIASDDGGVVKYAFQDPTGWHTQTVGTGNNISLALGTSGSAQMSIVSNTTSYTGTLYYAFQDDFSWLTQTIAVGRPFGDTSIALDYQGDPHISYIQYSCRWFCWEYGCFWVCDQGGLNYTYRDGSNWNILPLETGVSVGPHISSSLDQEEYPHISFQGNGNLMYIYQDSTGWYTETVDSSPGVGDYSSLVLDGAGQPYISYYDSTNANLKFAFRDEQGWHVQTIDSALTVGTYTSLALDKFGFPHISYDNATNGDLKHAYFAPKFITPLFQGGFGTPGSTVTYTLDIHNLASQMETYSIDVGQNDWNSSLSDELVGPLPPYNSQTITLSVSIPQDTPWYLTDTVVITAASVSNPMINFSTARVTTQAFALPQINVSPLSMETNQAVGQTTTQTLTISNGNGVTLTFNIYYEITGSVLNMHLNEPDGSTKFHDSSGNLNEGTCIGATCPTSGLPGKHGTALFFDGTDDLISVANDQSLNPQNAMAISAWIYAEDWNGNKRILQKGMWDNQYRLMAEDGALHFDIYTIGRVTADLPSTGAWHHVVGVFDGNQMQLWVDGELKAEQAAIGMIPSTTDPVYLGTKCLGCWVYDYFYGKIDEVMVFNRALNSWEIQALYAGWLTDKYYWLDVKPDTGGVPENSALPILVSFDAIGAQPDTYTTTLFLMNNDPIQPMVRVPVTMTVEPSPTMGWVEGLITDMRTGEPMEATIIAQGQPFTVTSAADTGKYLLWLEPGSYTLEVSAAGYIPQTGQVEINTNMGSLQDFGVLRDAAWMQYIPEKFEITVGVNQLLTQTLKFNQFRIRRSRFLLRRRFNWANCSTTPG